MIQLISIARDSEWGRNPVADGSWRLESRNGRFEACLLFMWGPAKMDSESFCSRHIPDTWSSTCRFEGLGVDLSLYFFENHNLFSFGVSKIRSYIRSDKWANQQTCCLSHIKKKERCLSFKFSLQFLRVCVSICMHTHFCFFFQMEGAWKQKEEMVGWLVGFIAMVCGERRGSGIIAVVTWGWRLMEQGLLTNLTFQVFLESFNLTNLLINL